MKIRILSLVLLVNLVFFTSCNNNDDDAPAVIETWNLKNTSGGFVGINLDYNEGEVVWIFNSEDEILTIKNNVMTTGPENIYSGPETGDYSYTITTLNGEEFLSIENNELHENGEYGKYEINENGELIIDQGEGSVGVISDAFIMTFE